MNKYQKGQIHVNGSFKIYPRTSDYNNERDTEYQSENSDYENDQSQSSYYSHDSQNEYSDYSPSEHKNKKKFQLDRIPKFREAFPLRCSNPLDKQMTKVAKSVYLKTIEKYKNSIEGRNASKGKGKKLRYNYELKLIEEPVNSKKKSSQYRDYKNESNRNYSSENARLHKQNESIDNHSSYYESDLDSSYEAYQKVKNNTNKNKLSQKYYNNENKNEYQMAKSQNIASNNACNENFCCNKEKENLETFQNCPCVQRMKMSSNNWPSQFHPNCGINGYPSAMSIPCMSPGYTNIFNYYPLASNHIHPYQNLRMDNRMGMHNLCCYNMPNQHYCQPDLNQFYSPNRSHSVMDPLNSNPMYCAINLPPAYNDHFISNNRNRHYHNLVRKNKVAPIPINSNFDNDLLENDIQNIKPKRNPKSYISKKRHDDIIESIYEDYTIMEEAIEETLEESYDDKNEKEKLSEIEEESDNNLKQTIKITSRRIPSNRSN